MRIARYAHGGDVGYAVVEDDVAAVIDGHPFAPFSFTGVRHPLAEVRLLAPVLPTKVVAIGKNYAAHAAEMGGPAPASPVIFLKPSTAVVGPEDGIVYPVTATRVDYEGELAVVIGRICRRIGAAEALDYVLGYMCGNDVTARDQQAADGQWARAKGHDTFCPLGPWIETDVDPADVKVTTLLNGEVRQEATTASLLHSVPTLIEFVSAVMTLLPGDVLLTGTPEGVGPMSVGDEVSVRIDGIGALTNRVISGG